MTKPNATIFVRPAPGMRVRDPESMAVLPEAGASKPRNSYWERRVLFGDCIEGPAQAEKIDAEPFPTEAKTETKPRRKRGDHTENEE